MGNVGRTLNLIEILHESDGLLIKLLFKQRAGTNVCYDRLGGVRMKKRRDGPVEMVHVEMVQVATQKH